MPTVPPYECITMAGGSDSFPSVEMWVSTLSGFWQTTCMRNCTFFRNLPYDVIQLAECTYTVNGDRPLQSASQAQLLLKDLLFPHLR